MHLFCIEINCIFVKINFNKKKMDKLINYIAKMLSNIVRCVLALLFCKWLKAKTTYIANATQKCLRKNCDAVWRNEFG